MLLSLSLVAYLCPVLHFSELSGAERDYLFNLLEFFVYGVKSGIHCCIEVLELSAVFVDPLDLLLVYFLMLIELIYLQLLSLHLVAELLLKFSH